MNAPETLNPTTAPINLAHKVLLKADEALCVEEVARAILGGDKPTKACIKDAAKQLKKLADLGIIEMEPRAGGVPFYRLIAAPSCVVTHNPHTGTPRNPLDIESDPEGLLIVKDGEPLKAFMAGDSEGGETDAPAVDAQREEFTLLGLIADIRAAAGDPSGRLMQDELVQHIAGVVKERDDLRERLDAQIQQWQTDTGRLAADLRAAMESRSQAINEAARLRAELATERQAREALQEQSGVIHAAGYIVRAAKRKPRTIMDHDKAREAALSAIRAGAQRAEVFAIVPVGAARRGAEWRDA